jgi:hypothetical protein
VNPIAPIAVERFGPQAIAIHSKASPWRSVATEKPVLPNSGTVSGLFLTDANDASTPMLYLCLYQHDAQTSRVVCTLVNLKVWMHTLK